MKLKTSMNKYVSSNHELYISDDLMKIEAVSYNWWKYTIVDKVGNIFVNWSTYSPSTTGHQNNTQSIFRRLGINPNCAVYNTGENFNSSITSVLESSIENLTKSNTQLLAETKIKGSWKRKNKERMGRIESNEYRIKDLQNYIDNYVDKKLIQIKQKSLADFEKNDWTFNHNKTFEKYFKKQNGKLQINEYVNFLNKLNHYENSPASIDNIKLVFDLKENSDIVLILLYRFANDLNNMIPNVDSVEYIQLKRRMKSLKIDKNNLTTVTLDKLHEYLTNRMNRKAYEPKEATQFNLSDKVKSLIGVKDFSIIQTDTELRSEGRKMHHCIGGKHYIQSCINGYQALNYKGYTFYLNSDNKILQSNGSYNKSVPTEITNELKDILK